MARLLINIAPSMAHELYNDWIKNMLFNFDYNVLDDPNFKEDSVREEIIAPILKKLGYKPSGEYKITRSKSLIHPFVKIGSKKIKIYIIPDYTIEINDNPMLIIEAKSPTENILMTEHVEQAFSYAIHPEIRCKQYALCNGRMLVLYSIDRFEPIFQINLNNIQTQWQKIEKALSPKYLITPQLRDFAPDFGMTLKKANAKSDLIIIFEDHYIQEVMMFELGKYTLCTNTFLGDIDCLLSLDITEVQLNNILSKLPNDISQFYSSQLKQAPYILRPEGHLVLSFNGHLGEITYGKYEEFIPLIVDNILDAKYDSSIQLKERND